MSMSSNDAEGWFNKGFALYKLGKYQEAIICYDKEIKAYPNEPLVRAYKGLALNGLGRYEEAIIHFNKALEIHPRCEYAWFCKASTLADMRKYEEALRCAEEVVEINRFYKGIQELKQLILEEQKLSR